MPSDRLENPEVAEQGGGWRRWGRLAVLGALALGLAVGMIQTNPSEEAYRRRAEREYGEEVIFTNSTDLFTYSDFVLLSVVHDARGKPTEKVIPSRKDMHGMPIPESTIRKAGPPYPVYLGLFGRFFHVWGTDRPPNEGPDYGP